jgi:hypothetical protein
MRDSRKGRVRVPHNVLAILVTGCTIAGLSVAPRIISAQIPDSKPKPGQGSVVKLHGQPYLVVSLPAGESFHLSGGCVPGRPILTFTVQVSNQGNVANRTQPPENVVALDDAVFPERWQGQASVPQISPGQSVTVNIPVMYAANLAVSGAHIFRLYVLGDAGRDPGTKAVHSANVRVVFPDNYCAPPNTRPKPQQAPPPNKNPKLVRPGLPFSVAIPRGSLS